MVGALVMELNRINAQNCDRLVVAGDLTVSGTLVVTNLGAALQAGDTFQLFNQAVTGFATVTLPSLGAGLLWQNNLASNGSLAVVPVVSTTPINIAAQFTANDLTLSWPADHIGWRLQVQTNALTAGLGTNWFDVIGANLTNQVVCPIDPLQGGVFFRLIYP
ncbi:MAG: hypothetical protein QM813_07540 [Verrucomicrobiota bacterium]